jgi:hypothetical protein
MFNYPSHSLQPVKAVYPNSHKKFRIRFDLKRRHVSNIYVYTYITLFFYFLYGYMFRLPQWPTSGMNTVHNTWACRHISYTLKVFDFSCLYFLHYKDSKLKLYLIPTNHLSSSIFPYKTQIQNSLLEKFPKLNNSFRSRLQTTSSQLYPKTDTASSGNEVYVMGNNRIS